MPEYTLKDIDELAAKGLLSKQEHSLLRQDFYQQSNAEEGALRKLVGHLSHEITEGWTNIKAGASQQTKAGDNKTRADVGSSNIQIVAGALQLLSALPTALGKTSGESVQDFLLKRGANQTVAALAATVFDIGTSVVGGGVIGKGIRKGVVDPIAKSMAAKQTANNETVRKGIADWMEQTLLADKTAAVGKEAAKKTADDQAKAIIDATNAKLKNITNTQKLLDDAAETVRGATDETTSSTTRTLDAAMSTLLGKQTPEAVVNELTRRTEVKRAVRELDKIAEATPLVRGGLDVSRGGDIGAFARARQKFDEGLEKYEAGKINLKDLQKQAQASNMTINDVLNLKPGEAKTPGQVAEISKPVRAFGESFIKNVDAAEAGIAKGDYGKFWESLSDFHLMVEAHWPYMFPRQVAGQTLKTYDEPVLSGTRFLQQVPRFSSWLAKLKLADANEIEAAAPLILREMQKIKAPSEISNFAKRIAEETAEHGDEALSDPTFRDKARFLFVNSLMSGTDTIGRNITGNVAGALWHYPEKLSSSIASKALNPFLSAKHHLEGGYANEANVFMSTWARSMWDASHYALRRQWDEMRGLIPDEQALTGLLDNRFDLKTFANTGTTNPFSGTMGKIIGTPVSIAQAADEVSRIALYRAAASERLYRNWVSSGSELPWATYLDEGLKNIPPSAHEYAMRVAGEFTYSDRMTAFGRGISNLRELVPGSELIMPFIRTADRLTAFQYNRSPVLSLMSKRLLDEVNSGDATVRAEAVGRIMWANIVGAGLFVAAKTQAPDGMNLITGGGPTDRQLAGKLKDAKVHVPYSIWTPEGRIGFSGLAPIRGPLGLIADTAEVWDEIRNPTEASSLWDGIALGISRNFFDMTYTKQLGDIIEVWDNPSRSSSVAARLGSNIVKGFVEPAIVRQIFREFDPAVKESHDFWSELTREVPGWGGPARRNPLTGEPVLNPPRLLADVPVLSWFLPTSPIQPATDAFAKKIGELKLKPPDFPEAFAGSTPSESPFAYSGPLGEAREARSGIPIPKELREKARGYAYGAEDFGETLNDEAQRLVSDPEFNKLAPIDQADSIRTLYHSRYGVALERLKGEHPELLEAYEVKMQMREAVRLPPEDREAFQQTMTAPEPVEDFSLLPAEGETP